MSTLKVDNISPHVSWGADGRAPIGVTPGVVLQVIEGFSSTELAVTNTNVWTDTGLELTITPGSTSSKILLQASWEILLPGITGHSYRFTRGGVSIFTPSLNHSVYNGTAGNNHYHMPALQQLDAPNTTSAIVYKLQLEGHSGTSSYFNLAGAFRASIVATEIAG
jgi:hypothetical protein